MDGDFTFDDIDADEGELLDEVTATKDGIVFVVDASLSMFQPLGNEDKSSAFDVSLRCIENTIKNKIVASSRDLAAILFYGTDKHKNTSDFSHIYVLRDLEWPGAALVLQLENMRSHPDDFKKNYGHSQDYSLGDVLWIAQSLFAVFSQKGLGFKRILLFTNNDNPHGHNAAKLRHANTKALDLVESDIDLDVIPVMAEGDLFNWDTFYKRAMNVDSDVVTMPDSSSKIEELLERVRMKQYAKRSLGKVNFSFHDGLNMAVGVYNLIGEARKPTAIKLEKKSNEEVKTRTSLISSGTGKVLMKSEVELYQEYGGRKIAFDQDEVKEMKSFGESGLTLMGFKRRSQLKAWQHVRSAQFLYPLEKVITGSATLFSALHARCLARDVIAICKFVARVNTPPRLVALVAQKEEVNETNIQTCPPGFHVITIPYSDDIRNVAIEPISSAATVDQVDKVKEIVKKLTFKFSPDNFENPALQKHWRNVEALALDRASVEDMHDYTQPDLGMIEKRAGQFIRDLKSMVYPAGYVPDGKKAAASKTAPKGTAAVDIKGHVQAGTLAKLTVPVLTQFCQGNNIKLTAKKKADVISAINLHFGVK